jgi:hypothetical protein
MTVFAQTSDQWSTNRAAGAGDQDSHRNLLSTAVAPVNVTPWLNHVRRADHHLSEELFSALVSIKSGVMKPSVNQL